MVSKLRAERIGGRIKEELSEMLINDISDPRLSGIFITDVKVDRELTFADIYISAVEGIQLWREIKSGLEHAQGFIRHMLAERIELRVFPRLRFHWDPTPERAASLDKLFASLQDEEAQNQNPQKTGIDE
ncbi:MAG: 30S ribosome-binding factor RbfA [Anaerolineales bacterium]|nr:30S ribosome-binding factor RbfA [Anaerolineales bacterium]